MKKSIALPGSPAVGTTESGFAEWLKRSASHARAFEEATEIWQDAKRLPRPKLTAIRRARPLTKLAAAVALLGAVAAGTYLCLSNPAVATGIGEQRVLVLEDGSRVILNTRTRIVVAYDKHTRHLTLEEGEAAFEVAKRPDWPFVVNAGDHEVTALGTAFTVRLEGSQIAVTLMEGNVSVDHDARELAPGQRLSFTKIAPPALDTPPLDRLLAWERREVAFEDTSLEEAMQEMNRYNRKPLVAALPPGRSIHVTGLFRAGDSMSFARAVAEAYRLQVAETGTEFRLSAGKPSL